MLLRRSLILLALLALGACGSRTVDQYLVIAGDPGVRIPIRISSLEVRDLSLPRHALADEIILQTEDGTIQALPNTAWADEPQRGLTLALAFNLSRITGARIAPEPWPFDDAPDAQVEVRVDRFLAYNDGIMRLSGQYVISGVGIEMTARSDLFDLAIPLPGPPPSGVAQAQANAIQDLAELIARRIAR